MSSRRSTLGEEYFAQSEAYALEYEPSPEDDIVYGDDGSDGMDWVGDPASNDPDLLDEDIDFEAADRRMARLRGEPVEGPDL